MITFRWIVGTGLVLGGLGCLWLVFLANVIRRVSGTPPYPLRALGLPLLAFLLLIAALLFPACTALLHAAAVAALGLAVASLREIFAHGARPLWSVVLCLAAWFAYYAFAAFGDVVSRGA